MVEILRCFCKTHSDMQWHGCGDQVAPLKAHHGCVSKYYVLPTSYSPCLSLSYNNVDMNTHTQFECEFRRFSLDRTQMDQFDAFYSLVKDSHHLPSDMPFTVSYTDPRNGDLLPITNSDNLMRAYTTAMPLLRLVIYRQQGERGDRHSSMVSCRVNTDLCML